MSVENCTEDEILSFLSILEKESTGLSSGGLTLAPILGFYKTEQNTLIQALKRFLTYHRSQDEFKHGHIAVKIMRGPFERVPLYVGHKAPEVQAMVKWRLGMAR